MHRFIALLILTSACSFGPAPEEEKKSFTCDDTKFVCTYTRETCISSDKKKKCTTSVDFTCNSRGDEGAEMIWQNSTMTIGNTKVIINCQVSKFN